MVRQVVRKGIILLEEWRRQRGIIEKEIRGNQISQATKNIGENAEGVNEAKEDNGN